MQLINNLNFPFIFSVFKFISYIYPNPTNGNITIEIINQEINNCYLEIYNLIGNKIKSIPINSNIQTTNLYPINNGLYFYKIINNNITLKTGKVLIF